jgi:hypothetical protein
MSISQLSISYLQEVSAATQERRLYRCFGEAGIEVMVSTVTNPPHLCDHHLQGHRGKLVNRENTLFKEAGSCEIFIYYSPTLLEHIYSGDKEKATFLSAQIRDFKKFLTLSMPGMCCLFSFWWVKK